MKRFICVRSSVQVKQTPSFNEWQKELADEREFLRLVDNFKTHIKENRER